MLIHNACVLTMDEGWSIIENGAVYIKGDKIEDVGSSEELRQKYIEPEPLDAGGRILMPGFVNAHMHLYSTMARGIALRDEPPVAFNQILERLWWRLDKALDDEAVRLSAWLPLIQAIRKGTTTIIDHHASPRAIAGSLDVMAEIFEKIGLRGVLCYEVSDRDGAQAADTGIGENVRFIERCHKYPSPLLRGMFGLHASFTLSEDTLRRCAEAARSLSAGCHVHCAEAASDVEYTRKNFGKSPVERFFDAGILEEKAIAAHCVHVSERDIALLAESKTNAIHNPRSNMNNAVGCAPVLKMISSGVRVGLGTDGMNACMTDELKTAFILHKHENHDPRVGWAECPQMLFKTNPRLATQIFGSAIGVLAKGALADIILLDYFPPTPMTPQNLAGHILFGIADAPVRTTIVGGRVLMKDGVLIDADEEEISRRSREVAGEVWKRF